VEISRSTNGRQTNSKQNFNVQPNKATKHGLLQLRWMDQHALQKDGTNRARNNLWWWWRLLFKVEVSRSYVTIGGKSASLSWCQTPIWGPIPQFLLSDSCGFWWCGAPYLTWGRVCRLQLLLALGSVVILWSEFRGAHAHILLSDSRLPQPGRLGARIYIPPGTGQPSYTCRN
jgi:hypothetical protein